VLYSVLDPRVRLQDQKA
jgi:hypothetical protein